MSRFSPLAVGFALPFSVLAQTALADLTPQDVWSDWRAYMEGMGYQISATEAESGDDLAVRDLTLSFAIPEDEGTMQMSLGTISFNQNSDGTVAIVLPDLLPVTFTGKESGPGGEDFTMNMNVAQTGHQMVASGSPEQTTYVYTADTLAMDMVQMQVGSVVRDQADGRFNFVGNGIDTTTTMTIGETRGYAQTGSIESMTYDMAFTDPETPEISGAINGTVTGMTITGNGAIPLNIEQSTDMAAMIAAGFDVAGKFSYAAGSSNFDMKDPDSGNFVMATSSQGGDFDVKMGANGLAYDVAQRDLNVAVTVEGMPFPFEVAMAESGFNISMPVSKSDDPQDFAFGLQMADFSMSDFIWNIFDPAAQLPRDPANIMLDLTGKVRLLVDILNPEAAAGMTSAPGELQALTLSQLLVAAAGAKLEGSGALAFDAGGPAIVPGLGAPVGDVNLALSGGNGLLDKLVSMGILPADQAMGARMMMGLFAVPGDAPDTLKSKIEFLQDGQILANGQRIR